MISVQTMMMNEIDLIPRYAKFVQGIASEWVIIDGGSTDGTLEYLDDFKYYWANPSIKIISDEAYNLSNCKNFTFLLNESLKYCTNDWVWLGYVDEFVYKLPNCIPKLVQDKIVWRLPRMTVTSFRPFGYMKLDSVIRMYPRDRTEWIGGPIHDERLKSPYPTKSFDDIQIFHIGAAMKIAHIQAKEKRFGICGHTELTDKFNEESRSKLPFYPIPDFEISELFYTRRNKIWLNPDRIFYFSDRIESILNGRFKDPVMIEIFPVSGCNHMCEGCLFHPYRSNEILPLLSIKKLLVEVNNKVRSIEYCGGGEPTLHPDFGEILRIGSVLYFNQGLITNGSTLEKWYQDFVRYLSYIRISLDSPRPETHKIIHQSDDFNNIINGIRLLVKERNETNSTIEIGLKMLLRRENKEELGDMVQLARDLDVDSLQIKAARSSGHDLNPSESSIHGTLNKLKENNPDLVFGDLNKSFLSTNGCIANLLSCFIDSAGTCFICCYYQGREKEHSFGNIHHKTFWDIWYSPEHSEAVKNINKNLCNVYDCRFHAYNTIMFDLKKSRVRFI